MMCLLIVLFLFIFEVYAGPVVTLPNGKIEGISTTTLRNKIPFYAYMGIPFAAAPVGKFRFQPPQPPTKWSGIFNATSNDKVCYQITTRNIHGQTEDCLTVNVYTTAKPGDNPQLPVMVGIYGGSFTHGFASKGYYGPQHIIEQGVLVVTFNYRVGPFGFLSTGDGVISGNMGLKDQLFALQWVNKNIQNFGGDPRKVSIYGQSAGAASVTYQILSPKSTGLFRAAISSSGSALCEWALQRNPANQAYGVAAAINASFTKQHTTKQLLEFLQNIPAESIHGTQGKYGAWAPVLETAHEGAIITESMYESLKIGKFNKVPLLSGINSEEELSHAANLAVWKSTMKLYDQQLGRAVPQDLNVKNNNTSKDIGQIIRNFYTNGGSFENNLGSGIQYMSDNVFSRANIKYAELQSHYTDVYFYQFSYHGKMGGNSISYPGIGKVQHGEEGKYFWATDMDLHQFPQPDVNTLDRYVGMITNFVKDLNPTPSRKELFQNIIWPKVTSSNFQYLDIDSELVIKRNPRESTFRKWETIYDKYWQPPYLTY